MDFANSLTPTTSNANAGSLVGNRMFYTTDYMVRACCDLLIDGLSVNEIFTEGSSWVKLRDIRKNVLLKNPEYGVYQWPKCWSFHPFIPRHFLF
jgi:hypothetical protein